MRGRCRGRSREPLPAPAACGRQVGGHGCVLRAHVPALLHAAAAASPRAHPAPDQPRAPSCPSVLLRSQRAAPAALRRHGHDAAGAAHAPRRAGRRPQQRAARRRRSRHQQRTRSRCRHHHRTRSQPPPRPPPPNRGCRLQLLAAAGGCRAAGRPRGAAARHGAARGRRGARGPGAAARGRGGQLPMRRPRPRHHARP